MSRFSRGHFLLVALLLVVALVVPSVAAGVDFELAEVGTTHSHQCAECDGSSATGASAAALFAAQLDRFVELATKKKYVHITKTGKKYHKKGCRYLKKSKKKVTLAYAKKNGYKPCKVCKPPKK